MNELRQYQSRLLLSGNIESVVETSAGNSVMLDIMKYTHNTCFPGVLEDPLFILNDTSKGKHLQNAEQTELLLWNLISQCR